ncbi:MAG: sugar ABC transporter permease [Treponema sp.]|nr:sugar ABC transporter permease [Treponema sp.]
MKKKGTISYAKYGYIFSIPFVVAFLIFSLYPTLYTMIIGFTDLKGAGRSSFHFLSGSEFFANFKFVLTSPTFLTALKNTFVIWICNFIPQMILALVLAAWFTDRRMKIPGAGAFKVLFYMPNIITAATVAILFNALFTYPMGPMNDLLMQLKIIDKPFNFLVKKDITRGIVIFIQTWMWYGYTMIIMISGILGISPDIFEAAEIDGASGWQVFWKITLPSIKTILLFTLITSLIGGLNMFDIPHLFMLGGPDNATLTTNVFIYNLAFKGTYQYGRAAAASMVMFVIIIILSAIMFYAMRDRDEVALRKQLRLEKKLQKRAAKGGK